MDALLLSRISLLRVVILAQQSDFSQYGCSTTNELGLLLS